MPDEDNSIFKRWSVFAWLVVFWAVVFVVNVGPSWEKFSSTRELIETAGLTMLLQLLVATVSLLALVPHLLDKGRWVLFLLGLFALLVATSEIFVAASHLYLEPTYPETHSSFLKVYAHMNLAERLDLSWSMRYLIFTKFPVLLFPTVLLVASSYYRKQRVILELSQQRVAAELDSLKNQLNPHFIFNTLNNIYALALKKSDLTASAVEKLAAILDYVVYRCSDPLVELQAEMTLIENYIALEKLRFGDRLQATISNQVTQRVTLPPLILLTLLENAVKHGAREEIDRARIDITVRNDATHLHIRITNSKPKFVAAKATGEGKVGLTNLHKQLQLLYPDAHRIEVRETAEQYTTDLSLALA